MTENEYMEARNLERLRTAIRALFGVDLDPRRPKIREIVEELRCYENNIYNSLKVEEPEE